MSTQITLPKSGEVIYLTSLKSGDKDNATAMAGYASNPENAETALETMKGDKNLVVDLVSAIFRENIGADTKPPASAILVPTFTLSPFFTIGVAGAPIC